LVIPFVNMINDLGEAVGGADLANSDQHDALLWKNTWQDLGNINGCAYAFWINAHRQVVGNWGSNGCEQGGFLWEDQGPMVDLNTLLSANSTGLTVNAAYQINDQGEIAGIGIDGNDNHFAVLLIPCDVNHPDIEGCEYSLVEAATAAGAHAAQMTDTLAAPSQATLSPGDMMGRYRSLMNSRNRRLGPRNRNDVRVRTQELSARALSTIR
jgi:probable HAF family extracellular repeat protein